MYYRHQLLAELMKGLRGLVVLADLMEELQDVDSPKDGMLKLRKLNEDLFQGHSWNPQVTFSLHLIVS